jgi:hypothetical protein
MAYTLIQQPTSPNVAYTNLIYVVSSSNYEEPNYSYICDIYPSGSSELITRLRTKPNSEGYGILDTSVALQNYLSYDNNWKTEDSTENTGSSKVFDIQFGEEYGTSISSSLTLTPNIIGANNIMVFKGTIDQQELNSFNFNQDLFDSSSFEDNGAPKLSNYTLAKNINNDSYETLSIIGGELDSGYRFYSASITLYDATFPTYYLSPYTSSTPNNIINLGVGLPNLNTISESLNSYPYYNITLHYTGSGTSTISSSFRYNNNTPLLGDPPLTSSDVVGNDVWVTAANMINYFYTFAAAGIQNNAIANYNTRTQVYNGINWSVAPASNFNKAQFSGAGTTLDFAAAGGDNSLESFNGSAWTIGPSMLYVHQYNFLVGDGLNNLFAIVGALSGGVYSNLTEVFDGISWQASVGLPGGSPYWGGGVSGTVNAASRLSSAGPDTRFFQQFDGISWTNLNNLLQGGQLSNACGPNDDILYFGGTNNILNQPKDQSQKWDGIAWSFTSNLVNAKFGHGTAGSPQAGLMMGGIGPGFDNPNFPSGTEEYVTNYQPIVFSGNDKMICYDETRFAFINEYGVWDYYSIYNPINKTTKLKRKSVDLPNVSYNDITSPYNIRKRGNTTYYTSNEDTYQITTDPLSQEEADWLTEMIESPNVFIQSGSDFIPVNIKNGSYTWRTNPKGQKIFQYTIEFNYSNNRRSTY